MNSFEVMSFRNSKKDKFALACQTVSGDRFVVRRVEVKLTDVWVKFADGTTAKPETLEFMERFTDAKAMQKFLLKQ